MEELAYGLQSFCNNPFLSDCVLKHEDLSFKVHKVVLASYSRYFFKFFQENQQTEVEFPECVKPKSTEFPVKEVIPEVIKFMYSCLDIESFSQYFKETNAFVVLSIAFKLEIPKLIEISENYIVVEMLKPDTAVFLLKDALLFNSEKIISASTNQIVNHFEDVIKDENMTKEIFSLPYDLIKSIVANELLGIETEFVVFEFLCAYIENFNAQNPENQLEDQRKLELFSLIRWSYLSHAELLKAANNPLVAIAKDLVLEGLSAQLSFHEEAEYSYKIHISPRESYKRSGQSLEKKGFFTKKPLASSQNFSSKKISQIFRITESSEALQNSFEYSYDFDENGVLFYLGTKGRTTKWQNPHVLGEVRVFCSSLAYGRLEDFVGRTNNSLRTNNEEGSYLGIDIGQGRLFSPTTYTLKNSSNMSYAALNWVLEGSLDRNRWKILDKRIHFTGNPEYDSKFDTEISVLTKRAATSTWAIVPNKNNAFRFFRISVVNKNITGSSVLALSCIELYGNITSGKWP